MSFRRFLNWQLTFGLLLTAFGQIACAETLLRWKLVTGESLRYEFKQNTQTETAGAGRQMRVAMDTSMVVTWKVESVDSEKVATIMQSIDRFTITMTTDKLDPITYDSAAKSPPIGPAREIAEGVGKFIGTTCRIQMSDRGEIKSVEPSSQLKQALESTAKLTPANPTANLLTPEGVSKMLQQAAVVLPEKPVAEGATWNASQESRIALGIVLQRSQFTYGGSAQRGTLQLEKITVETTFGMAPNANSLSVTKLKEGQQTGTLWFDSAAGRFVSSELSQRLVTERPYRDTTIRVHSTSTLTMTLQR